jgi:hypothetical protein
MAGLLDMADLATITSDLASVESITTEADSAKIV